MPQIKLEIHLFANLLSWLELITYFVRGLTKHQMNNLIRFGIISDMLQMPQINERLRTLIKQFKQHWKKPVKIPARTVARKNPA